MGIKVAGVFLKQSQKKIVYNKWVKNQSFRGEIPNFFRVGPRIPRHPKVFQTPGPPLGTPPHPYSQKMLLVATALLYGGLLWN